MELPNHHLTLLTECEKATYASFDNVRQHTFAFAFADGLVADVHNVESASDYGKAYCEGWIAGDAVRRRVYLAGIHDGLDDAEGRNKPDGLNADNSDDTITRIDRYVASIYRTGLQNGSTARNGHFPISR